MLKELLKYTPLLLTARVTRICLAVVVLFLDLPCARSSLQANQWLQSKCIRSSVLSSKDPMAGRACGVDLLSARLMMVAIALSLYDVLCKTQSVTQRITKWTIATPILQSSMHAAYIGFFELSDQEKIIFCMPVNSLIAVYLIWELGDFLSKMPDWLVETKPASRGNRNPAKSCPETRRCLPHQQQSVDTKPGDSRSSSRTAIDELTTTMGSFTIGSPKKSAAASATKRRWSASDNFGDNVSRGSSRTTRSHIVSDEASNLKAVDSMDPRQWSPGSSSGCQSCSHLLTVYDRQLVLLYFLLVVSLISIFFNGAFATFLFSKM